MKAVVVGVSLLALIVVISVVLFYGGILSNEVQANYNKRVVTSKIEQQVHTPEFAQPAYDHFFDLCAAIQSDEIALDSQFDQLKSASKDDRDRILSNISGLRSERASSIAQYNADANKDFTLGQFRDAKLPYNINNTNYIKGVHTSCVN